MRAQKNLQNFVQQRSTDYPSREDLDSTHWKNFARELDLIGRDIKQRTSLADFKQFRKFEMWGRLATCLGYATAWLGPNPFSVLLMSLGNYARWSLVLHPVSHGAFDHLEGVPSKYKSTHFGKGLRRFIDWFDWITPESWDEEHNGLHHYHLGSPKDPDVVIRNTEYIRTRSRRGVRYLLTLIMICVWKPAYYAVNTLTEARFKKGLLKSNKIGANSWSIFTPEGRALWFQCLIPYASFKFVVLPSVFLPLGSSAAFAVFLNSVLSEILTNIHSFVMIAPNHTGDDIYTFAETAKGKPDYYLRQITGTVNYPSTGDFMDFIYGGMNYQVEHHLWPEASLLQCRLARPKLIDICRRYGVPYREEPVSRRFLKTLQIVAGESSQPEILGGRIR